jgi:hypothetical protein
MASNHRMTVFVQQHNEITFTITIAALVFETAHTQIPVVCPLPRLYE